MLRETGRHITRYWTNSNKIAAAEPLLQPFIEPKDIEQVKAQGEDYRAGLPKFCFNLQLLATGFAIVHVVTTYLLIRLAAP
jgi:hypothetical protein